jgi:transcriptional regulator of acetoin/glycerol metabolism
LVPISKGDVREPKSIWLQLWLFGGTLRFGAGMPASQQSRAGWRQEMVSQLAIIRYRGNIGETARRLGIGRSKLNRKRDRMQILVRS